MACYRGSWRYGCLISGVRGRRRHHSFIVRTGARKGRRLVSIRILVAVGVRDRNRRAGDSSNQVFAELKNCDANALRPESPWIWKLSQSGEGFARASAPILEKQYSSAKGTRRFIAIRTASPKTCTVSRDYAFTRYEMSSESLHGDVSRSFYSCREESWRIAIVFATPLGLRSKAMMRHRSQAWHRHAHFHGVRGFLQST